MNTPVPTDTILSEDDFVALELNRLEAIKYRQSLEHNIEDRSDAYVSRAHDFCIYVLLGGAAVIFAALSFHELIRY